MIATRKQLPRLDIAGVHGMTHTKLVTPGGASMGSVKNVRNIGLADGIRKPERLSAPFC
jgi:hypothetical protein